MPKTKHYAIAPDGTTFHRTSQNRVYSHLVIGQLCPDNAMRQATSSLNTVQDERNWQYMADKVSGKRDWYDFESEQSRAKDRAEVAAGLEAYLAKKLAQRIERVEGIDFTQWKDLGWASRLDLAQKNASSHSSRPSWKRVEILGVQITP